MRAPPITIMVTVAYATPEVETLLDVHLPADATIDDAVARSGIIARFALDLAQLEFAIFGQRAPGRTPLRQGDRVELTRALLADPKQVRRRRASEQSPRVAAAKSKTRQQKPS